MKKTTNEFVNEFDIKGTTEDSNPGPNCPNGREKFIGTILSIQRGGEGNLKDWIMTIQSDRGYIVYGICPLTLLIKDACEDNIHDMIGNKISFYANFRPVYGDALRGQFYNTRGPIEYTSEL